MSEQTKKYRLGNQPQEYELKEDYLGWLPEYFENWGDFIFRLPKNVAFSIFNPNDGEKKTLFLHHFIIKDAFPLSFFGEERAEKWNNFAIVSNNQSSEKFIIPAVDKLTLTEDQKRKICDFLYSDEETPADETPGESVKKLLGLSEEEYKELEDEIEEVMLDLFGDFE